MAIYAVTFTEDYRCVFDRPIYPSARCLKCKSKPKKLRGKRPALKRDYQQRKTEGHLSAGRAELGTIRVRAAYTP